ncbi:MAG: hypothetical protein WC242_05585 [Candidatus Paceibacterota bacterium]|jgi:hypothetical protein
MNINWKIENLKTTAISWAITITLLFLATVYNYIVDHELGLIGIIFFASLVVYFAVYLIIQKRS